MASQLAAKPFLKWAGGKNKLIPQITPYLPNKLIRGGVKKYIEPFVGGGALFFHVCQHYRCGQFIIMDKNKDLITCYQMVKRYPHKLIASLDNMEVFFLKLENKEREKYYYACRSEFNQLKKTNSLNTLSSVKFKIKLASLFLFLNKTCYNGLYRLNQSGEFNVPFGRYVHPNICPKENLLACSKVLKKVEIVWGDYQESIKYSSTSSFFYFDPPYRPLTKSASFNAYLNPKFGDAEQIQLAKFYFNLANKKNMVMLSNSNPKNTNVKDNFFHNLYQNFTLHKVNARRNINSNSKKRGLVSELLITNY